MNKTIAITLTAALTMLSASAETSAAEPTYPGMMCQGGNLKSDSDGHAEYDSIFAVSTVARCPIVDDPDHVSPSDPTIWVTDRHYSQNVCCSSRLKIVDESLYFGSNACSSGSGSGYQSLDPSHPDRPYAFWWAHRFYQCTVPPEYNGNRSEIRTYRY